MKIPKLYTRGQFIDLQRSREFDPNDGYSYDEFTAERLGLIFRYNNFLKQPLMENMFVFVEPFYVDTEHREEPSSWSEDEIELYKAAQKKVIFDGLTPLSGGSQFSYSTGDNGAFMVMTPSEHETLNDLAEATNGELKLKNVEL